MVAPDVTVTANLGGSEVDITDYVRIGRGISISRGRQDEASNVDRGSCTFTLSNDSGTFSFREPANPYYGTATRSAPVSVSVPSTNSRLQIPSFTGGSIYRVRSSEKASTGDTSSLSITGDLEVIVDVRLLDWSSGSDLVAKGDDDDGTLSYKLLVGWEDPAILGIQWSEDGSTPKELNADCPLPSPDIDRKRIRYRLDVDNGSGGHEAEFHYWDEDTTSWIQVGDTVVGSGTTSIYDSTADVHIGGYTLPAEFHSVEIVDGIGGTPVADPDFTDLTHGATSVEDTYGNTWTISDGALISRRNYRFHGFMSEWPMKWSKVGTDIVADVTAYGPLWRVVSGSKLGSPYRRSISRLWEDGDVSERPVAYWSMETGEDATSIPSSIPGGFQMAILGIPTLAEYEGFAASNKIPVVGTGRFRAGVPAYVDLGEGRVHMLCGMPDGGVTNQAVILRFYLSGGTAVRCDVRYSTGGSLGIRFYDHYGAILDSHTFGFNIDGVNFRMGVRMQESGGTVNYKLEKLVPGSLTGSYGSGSYSGSLGIVTDVQINPAYAGMEGMGAGHLTVLPAYGSLFDQIFDLGGYNLETPAKRITRLCGEEGIQVMNEGMYYDAGVVTMGVQADATLNELIRECERAECGTIYESREFPGILYRPPSETGLEPRPTLDYESMEEVVPDDSGQSLWNYVEVSRPDGGVYDTYEESGPLSIEKPPDGLGVVAIPLSVLVSTDDQLPHIGEWKIAAGTVDKPRFVPAAFNLLTRTTAEADDLLGLDITHAAYIENLPSQVGPDDPGVIVLGIAEELTDAKHKLSLTLGPDDVYHQLIWDDDESRYSGEGTIISLPRVEFSGSECRSTTATQQTDDLDVRVLVALDDWTPSSEKSIAARYDNSGGANERSWAFNVTVGSAGPHLHCYLSTDGSSYVSYTSTVYLLVSDLEILWIRFFYQASSGNVTFYWSKDGESWTQLGTTVSGAASGGLYDASADFQIGARSGTSVTSSIVGKIIEVHILDGEDGNALADTDPTEWTDGYSGSGTGTSEAGGDITTTATSVDVTCPDDIEWTHDDGDFDMGFGGEIATMTAVSGTGPFQVLTLTRSVNGVVKAHSAGTAIDLADPKRYAL